MSRKLFWVTKLFCCALLVSATTHAQLQKLYVHPKGTATVMQSQIIDSIRFIPLQQQGGAEVSLYNNVQITKDYFLINDYLLKTILLYKKDGKFVKSISYKKHGDHLYPDYREQSNMLVFFGNNKNYTLTPRDRIKISLDWNNPGNKKYFKKFIINLADTGFAIQKGVVDESDIISANQYEENAYWLGKITTGMHYNDSLDYELKIYRNNKLFKSFFPFNHINEPRFLFAEENAILNKTTVPGTYLVTRPFCDTVYKMINDSIFPYFHLILPLENTIPASFSSVPFKNKTDRQNFMRNNGWMFHQVYNIYETPAFIYFVVRYMSNFESYIYKKQTNITYKIKNIKADSSQYNLKLLSDFGVISRGEKFYKTVNAGELIDFFNQNKHAVIPLELESYLLSKPQSNTPVLVEFKFKN